MWVEIALLVIGWIGMSCGATEREEVKIIVKLNDLLTVNRHLQFKTEQLFT